MARAASFREADLKRAICATEKAGVRNYRVEVGVDGTIAVIIGVAATKPARKNSMDELLGQ